MVFWSLLWWGFCSEKSCSDIIFQHLLNDKHIWMPKKTIFSVLLDFIVSKRYLNQSYSEESSYTTSNFTFLTSEGKVKVRSNSFCLCVRILIRSDKNGWIGMLILFVLKTSLLCFRSRWRKKWRCSSYFRHNWRCWC